MKKSLEHVGVLGMHWGHRSSSLPANARYGTSAKTIHGKEVPTFKSVRGQPVQVDKRGRRVNSDEKFSLKSDRGKVVAAQVLVGLGTIGLAHTLYRLKKKNNISDSKEMIDFMDKFIKDMGQKPIHLGPGAILL